MTTDANLFIANSRFLKSQVQDFEKQRPVYVEFANLLGNHLLKTIRINHAPYGIEQARAKEIASFTEKCIRKIEVYKDPINQLTDLCGGRIITETLDEVDLVCAEIRQHFKIVEEENIGDRLKSEEFGYTAMHFIVELTPKQIQLAKDSKWISDVVAKQLVGKKAEIQVKTILQHLHADIAHDRIYKTKLKIPAIWNREMSRLAAMLETIDQAFSKVVNSIDAYEMNYGAYMNGEELKKELEIYKMMLETQPNNQKILHKASRIAIALDKFSLVKKMIDRKKAEASSLLKHDLAIALKGLNEWEQACGLLTGVSVIEPDNFEVWCDLGDCHIAQKNYHDSIEAFSRAFEIAPENPRVLKSFITTKIIWQHNISFLQLIQADLNRAIATCADWIQVGTYLPMSHFDQGYFYMLKGQYYRSLESYLKGFLSTIGTSHIVREIELIEKHILCQEILKTEKLTKGFTWLHSLLKLLFDFRDQGSQSPQTKNGLGYLKSRQLKVFNEKNQNLLLLIGKVKNDMESSQIINFFQESFKNYSGTTIEVAKTEAIGHYLLDQDDNIRIGYIPHHLKELFAKSSMTYREYISSESRETDSPLEAVQYWTDLLSSGFDPQEVKAISFNGDRVCGFETQLALALGAKVGLIDNSGGATEHLLNDDFWMNLPNAFPFSRNTVTIQLFISEPTTHIPNDKLEELGTIVHNNYRQSKLPKNLRKWEHLLEDFKKSNIDQVRFSEWILKQSGFVVVPKSSKVNSIKKFEIDVLTQMAKMEHGRWMIERFMNGWKYGNKKDEEKKLSPNLVPWERLPDSVKKWDVEAVEKFPDLFDNVGLAIVKLEE